MQELVNKYLKENPELYKKYCEAEKKYYERLGDNYETIELELEMEEDTLKNMFTSLAKAEICLDDYIVCLFKIEIVKEEMEKL